MRMKLFLLLCGLICTLRCHANSVKVDELYRTLNISCTGKDELTKICRDARESYPQRTATVSVCIRCFSAVKLLHLYHSIL